MKMFLSKVKDVLKFLSAILAANILKINPKNRDIWIITERRAECKDNGYYLFKYMRENYPERKVYYAIEKDSPQKKRIEQYGNILDSNSWKHYVYALSATRLIGAFIPCGIPDSICFYKFNKFVKGKRVFLQHGITKEKIPALFYDRTGLDCFICGAKPEFEAVVQDFQYPKGAVQYTGFCRFDGLHTFQTEKFVLLMPTWRHWIPSATWHNSGMGNPEDYAYFRCYKKLVNDVTFRESLLRHDMRMIFYLHHETQPYLEYFGQSDNIVTFATEKDYDVQDLLKSCSCLITDYSSVAFDVGYMNKPIIYYQFDEDEYYSKHYQKGYFDYNTMGFGAKCETIIQVNEQMRLILENSCQMAEQYQKRVDEFFVYRDMKNCERVFQAIKQME